MAEPTPPEQTDVVTDIPVVAPAVETPLSPAGTKRQAEDATPPELDFAMDNLADSVETLANKFGANNTDAQKELFKMVGALVGRATDAESSATKLKEKNEVLNQAAVAIKDAAKSTAKAHVEEAVKVIRELLQQHAPAELPKDEDVAALTNSLVENPGALNMLRGVAVAASAVHRQHKAVEQLKKDTEMETLKNQIRVQAKSLNTFQQIGGHVQAPTAMPPPEAAPCVQVAASNASARGSSARSVMPAWLKEQIQPARAGGTSMFGADLLENPVRSQPAPQPHRV
jgi:hypothetical protein